LPDLLLSCDPEDRQTYFRTRPSVIVEVLSESTERIDRREKLLSYTSLPSLQDDVLESQAQRKVWHHRRTRDWVVELLTAGGLTLDCLNLALPLASVYEEIEGLG